MTLGRNDEEFNKDKGYSLSSSAYCSGRRWSSVACTGPVKLVSTTSITSTLSPEAILYVRAFFQSTERTDSRTTTTIFLTVSRRRLLCRRFTRQHLSSSRNTAHSGRRIRNTYFFMEHFSFHSRVDHFTSVEKKMSMIYSLKGSPAPGWEHPRTSRAPPASLLFVYWPDAILFRF